MIQSFYTPKYMQNHQFQGQSNDCGPYCTAVLVNLLKGTNLDGETIGQKMNKVAWNGPLPVVQRIKNWATFPWGVVHQLKSYGISARWQAFTNPNLLFANLVQNIHTIVIIGEIHPIAWAHYLILTAHDPVEGWGFINSATQSSEIFWIPASIFITQWKAYGRISITL